jgi:hypothetical protein
MSWSRKQRASDGIVKYERWGTAPPRGRGLATAAVLAGLFLLALPLLPSFRRYLRMESM